MDAIAGESRGANNLAVNLRDQSAAPPRAVSRRSMQGVTLRDPQRIGVFIEQIIDRRCITGVIRAQSPQRDTSHRLRIAGRSRRGQAGSAAVRTAHADMRAFEWEHRLVPNDLELPDTLTLDQAYRAAFFLTDLYVGVESNPDEGLVLFHEYLQSDPARWEDWKRAVGRALRADAIPDPLVENLLRD